MSSYKVINASAGSGKTYTLVKNLLKICLRSPQPEIIRNILALTFTNKAANEMKVRILDWLKEFNSENYRNFGPFTDLFEEMKREEQNLSMEELQNRSKKLLDYILHHYSVLSISTIDKFNSGLIRAFALELGLPHNYSIEINAEPYLLEAVDQTLEKVGGDSEISKAIMDLVYYHLDNEEKVKINSKLYESAKKLNSDKHYFDLNHNKDFDWLAYINQKDKLKKEIQELNSASKKIAENSLAIIENKKLSTGDFAGGNTNGIAIFFQKYLKNNQPSIPKNEENALQKFQDGASAKSKNRKNEILEILDDLIENRAKIISNFGEIKKKERILQSLLPLKINKEIQEQLQLIEEENDLLLLSRFNTIIYEQLQEEPSEFIYEKVGTKYQHYFFDEFQDTSLLQWKNILPLRNEVLSHENTSFTIVGDPKQSIYRWRGGDPQLMLDIIQKKENSPQEVTLEDLKTNYRSSKNIVDFNNRLALFLSHHVKEDYQKIFGELSQQKAFSKKEGRVRIHLFENKTVKEFYEDIVKQMTEDIQACVNRGYKLSDIAILFRGNTEIQKTAQLLSLQKIDYQNEKTYIKTISDKGLTLDLSHTINAVVQFLKWHTFPENRQFLVLCLYHLYKSGRVKMEDFSREILEILEEKTFEKMLQAIERKYQLVLSGQIQGLNTFNFIENILQEFSVEHQETDYLINFLELLYNYFQNSAATLKDFLLFWEEEGHKVSIQASENVDAVQLLTIHKSKGLEFPIVILPMKNENKDTILNDWFTVNEKILKKTNISGFNLEDRKVLAYHPEMTAFLENNDYKNKIDRFCVQYVATTRAKDQLFLYVQKPTSEDNNKIEIYDFLNLNREEMEEDSFDFYKVSEEDLFKSAEENQPTKGEKLEITSLQNQLKSEKAEIKIATPSRNYQEHNESVKMGILTHEILEKINTRKDAPKILNEYLLEGVISQENYQQILLRLNRLFDEYPQYFDGKYKAINEREILFSKDGKPTFLRTDRLLETSKGWIIIDFKTGAEREKYETQIETYQAALEKAGEKVLKTEILYI